MRGVRCLTAAATLWLVGGCVQNSAPGNDREAALDPPARPAASTSAGEALAGVSPGLLKPETMTPADLGTLPQAGGACLFRMTEVGFPVFLYGLSAVIKLNGKLLTLPSAGADRYAADGLEVSVRPLAADQDAADEGTFESAMVVRLPGAPDELGFHGFSECGERAE